MSLYAGLLKNGWTMGDIDDMDILYYLRVMGYAARDGGKARGSGEERRAFIDEVWPT